MSSTEHEPIEVTELISYLGYQNQFKEPMLRLLAFCTEPRSLEEITVFLSTAPELRTSTRSSESIAESLTRLGGLRKLIQETDRLVPFEFEARKANSSEAVPQAAEEQLLLFETTDIGLRVREGLSVANRLSALLEKQPELENAAFKVLDLCESPQTFASLRTSLEANRLCQTIAPSNTGEKYAAPALNASFLLECLQTAGVIQWRNGWITTPEGKETAKEHRRQSKK